MGLISILAEKYRCIKMYPQGQIAKIHLLHFNTLKHSCFPQRLCYIISHFGVPSLFPVIYPSGDLTKAVLLWHPHLPNQRCVAYPINIQWAPTYYLATLALIQDNCHNYS